MKKLALAIVACLVLAAPARAQEYYRFGPLTAPLFFTPGTPCTAPVIASTADHTTGIDFVNSAIVVCSGANAQVALSYNSNGAVEVASGGQFSFSNTANNARSAVDGVMWRSGASSIQFDTNGAGGQLTAMNFNATTNTFQGSIVLPSNRFYLFSGQGGLSNGGNGVNKLSNNAANSSLTVQTTGVPTCSSNCGTSPSVAGSDSSGKVTMGATGSPASGWVLTFNATWTAAPSCVVTSALATMVIGKLPIAVVTTTSTMTVTTNGTAPATSDVYSYHCFL